MVVAVVILFCVAMKTSGLYWHYVTKNIFLPDTVLPARAVVKPELLVKMYILMSPSELLVEMPKPESLSVKLRNTIKKLFWCKEVEVVWVILILNHRLIKRLVMHNLVKVVLKHGIRLN